MRFHLGEATENDVKTIIPALIIWLAACGSDAGFHTGPVEHESPESLHTPTHDISALESEAEVGVAVLRYDPPLREGSGLVDGAQQNEPSDSGNTSPVDPGSAPDDDPGSAPDDDPVSWVNDRPGEHLDEGDFEGGFCEEDEDCSTGSCSNGVCVAPGFVHVPAGSFWMGSPPREPGRKGDEIRHQVTLTRSLFMSATEVTQGEMRELGIGRQFWAPDCEDCPAEFQSWYGALDVLNAMSRRDGFEQCYELTACDGNYGHCSLRINAPDENPYLCEGYRLPTEAEWEYAYRAGTETGLHNGEQVSQGSCDDSEASEIAWHCTQDVNVTQPVAQLQPNQWGLYDMGGNVEEFTADGKTAYTAQSAVDPYFPPDPEGFVIVRGGNYKSVASQVRAACRSHRDPDERPQYVGFRAARTVH